MTDLTDGCPHLPRHNYAAWMQDADRRTAKGERQVRCLVCRRWQWPAQARDGCPEFVASGGDTQAEDEL